MEGEGEGDQGSEGQGSGGGTGDSLSPEELAQLLLQALLNGNDGAHAGHRPGQAVAPLRRHGARPAGGGTYYLYRTLRNLDLDGVLEKLDGPEARQKAQQDGQELSRFEERLGKRTSTRPASTR